MGLTRRSSWSKAVAPLSPKPLPSTCTEMVAGKVMRPCCPARNVSSCCGRRRVRIAALAYTQSWAAPHEGFPPWATKCIFSGLREGEGIPAMQRTHPHPRHDRDWKARGFPCRPGSTATPSLFCRGQKDSGQKNEKECPRILRKTVLIFSNVFIFCIHHHPKYHVCSGATL